MANQAATALGKLRWAGVSPEERSAQMSALAKLAGKRMTKKQRSDRARKAALARHAKKRASQQSSE